MGQLMGIVGPLLLLGGAIFVAAKRCELLGICGETDGSSGIFGEASAAEETVPAEGETGGVDETASNLNEQGNWAGGSSKGCCVCQMQGDKVKCQRHGGAWFNPPAGSGGSNDQSIELSLQECNKDCGTSATPNRSEREKTEVKSVRCPSGYASVNGRCVRTSSSGSKGGGGGTVKSPTSGACPKGQVRNKLTGKCNTPITPATARYTYYRSYFADPYNPRPFRLFHRIAN